MDGFLWNGDRFRSDLTATLTMTLVGAPDCATLAMAVSQSASIAEAACFGREMACSAGCPHCCVLNVAILLPEGMLIAEWMRTRLSTPEMEAVEQRLRIHRCWGRWMDDDERIAKHVPCPFVDNGGSCIIHPVRPLACRGVTSLDSMSCRAALAPGVSDEVRLVPTDLLRKAAFDEGFTALSETLKSHDLDDRSIELSCGVLAFLEHPEYQDQFLSGARLPRELWV
jgi:Fe-S-cluster containining protein